MTLRCIFFLLFAVNSFFTVVLIFFVSCMWTVSLCPKPFPLTYQLTHFKMRYDILASSQVDTIADNRQTGVIVALGVLYRSVFIGNHVKVGSLMYFLQHLDHDGMLYVDDEYAYTRTC